MIEQIEGLGDQIELSVLTDHEVLQNPHIKLNLISSADCIPRLSAMTSGTFDLPFGDEEEGKTAGSGTKKKR